MNSERAPQSCRYAGDGRYLGHCHQRCRRNTALGHPVERPRLVHTRHPSPLPDGVVVQRGKGGQFYVVALAAKDGAERWRFDQNLAARDPVTSDVRVYVVDEGTRLQNILRR
jgi:hypothetical protein